MSQTSHKHSESSQPRHSKSRRRQVYGLNSGKSYFGQETDESYGIRLVIIGLILALLIGLAILSMEAIR